MLLLAGVFPRERRSVVLLCTEGVDASLMEEILNCLEEKFWVKRQGNWSMAGINSD